VAHRRDVHINLRIDNHSEMDWKLDQEFAGGWQHGGGTVLIRRACSCSHRQAISTASAAMA